MAFPAPVVIGPTARHTATVIFLHGLGDTGHGWSYAFSNIKSPHIKYICPTACSLNVTMNGGFKMPAWFDIRSLSVGNKAEEDEKNIKESAKYLQRLIDKEETDHGIPANRIVIGGFSQGGALALYTGLTSKSTLAGILALSSWLPLHKSFPADYFSNLDSKSQKGNQNTPILQCHGNADPVVQYKYGEDTAKILSKICTKHEFKTYNGLPHSSSDAELNDVREWLLTVLPPTK